jgi:hypothetical protein
MGITALLCQKSPLPHTKAVLFVGDDQGKVFKAGILLDKGMSTYHHMIFAVFDAVFDKSFFFCAQRSC